MDFHLSLRTNGNLLSAAARSAGVDAPVEHCPGWSVGRLVGHTAKVMQRTELCVRNGLTEAPADDLFTKLPREEAVFDAYDEILDQLADTLASADPEARCWNFTGTNSVNAFWSRRMAHEVEIHRWDAQHAAGENETGFDHDAAVDGIDELLFVLMPMRSAQMNPKLSASFHLHCTDTPGEWLTTFVNGKANTVSEHAKGDIAVRGPASSLYLWAWNRQPARSEGIEVIGNDALLEDWTTIVP